MYGYQVCLVGLSKCLSRVSSWRDRQLSSTQLGGNSWHTCTHPSRSSDFLPGSHGSHTGESRDGVKRGKTAKESKRANIEVYTLVTRRFEADFFRRGENPEQSFSGFFTSP